MPDLPIDTLFIIGLVLASCVGKVFQKKQNETPQPEQPYADSDRKDRKPSLGEILKEAWVRANHPEDIQPESLEQTPPPLPIEATNTDYNTDILLKNSAESKQASPIDTGTQGNSYSNIKNPTKHSWVNTELLSGSNSLKKAIILKEILDKPIALRSAPF